MESNALQTTPDVSYLTYPAWAKVKEGALDALRHDLSEPTLDQFMQARISRYPTPLVIGAIVAMVLIASFAFIISAGKELVVADRVLSSIPEQYGVALWWQHLAMIAILLLGEIGALSFALASSLFAQQSAVQVGLRIASVVSACLALLGNITLTALDPHPGEIVFAWTITLFPPLTVLAVGLVGERMLLEYLIGREQAISDYQAARQRRELRVLNAPAEPTYRNALVSLWAGAMVNCQPNEGRATFRARINGDLAWREELFEHQYRLHEKAPFSQVIIERPTTPPHS